MISNTFSKPKITNSQNYIFYIYSWESKDFSRAPSLLEYPDTCPTLEERLLVLMVTHGFIKHFIILIWSSSSTRTSAVSIDTFPVRLSTWSNTILRWFWFLMGKSILWKRRQIWKGKNLEPRINRNWWSFMNRVI